MHASEGLVWLELDSVVMEDTRFTCKQLAATFAYDDPDDHIRRSFRAVFSYDNDLLSTAQNLCGRLASLDEYRNNDKRFGEDIRSQLRYKHGVPISKAVRQMCSLSPYQIILTKRENAMQDLPAS